MKKLLILLLLFFSLLMVVPAQANARVFGVDPYGATLITGKGYWTQTAANDFKNIGFATVRGQLKWVDIETSPGVYDWTTLDAAVNLAQANGIGYVLPIQNPPSWDTDPNACGLPLASAEANFGKILAQRYETRIAAFEVGNEEWSLNTAKTCRQNPAYYIPVLEQTYTAIKNVNPAIQVGMFGFTHYTATDLHSFFYGLFSDPSNPGAFMDYINFHYYPDSDPDVTGPNGVPPFNSILAEIHADAAAFGHGQKPIKVTEFGWCINSTCNSNYTFTQQQQSDYILKVYKEAQESGEVSAAYVYTIDQGSAGDSITQAGKPTIAYNNIKAYIPLHPTW